MTLEEFRDEEGDPGDGANGPPDRESRMDEETGLWDEDDEDEDDEDLDWEEDDFPD